MQILNAACSQYRVEHLNVSVGLIFIRLLDLVYKWPTNSKFWGNSGPLGTFYGLLCVIFTAVSNAIATLV